MSDTLIPRPYGVIGMIGQMLAEGEITPLREAVGLVFSGETRHGLTSSLAICHWLVEHGLVAPHSGREPVVIRKRPESPGWGW